MMELRCWYRKHAELFGECSGCIEIRCTSAFCGAMPGIVVIHQWDLSTGKLNETKQYKSPQLNRDQKPKIGRRTR